MKFMNNERDSILAAYLNVARELGVEDEAVEAVSRGRDYTPTKPNWMTDEKFMLLLQKFQLARMKYEDAFRAEFEKAYPFLKKRKE